MGKTSVTFAGRYALVSDYEEDCLWKRAWQEGDEGNERDADYVPDMSGSCMVKIGSRQHGDLIEVVIPAIEAHRCIAAVKGTEMHWLFRWMFDRLLVKRPVFVAYIQSEDSVYYLQSGLREPDVVLGLKPVGHVAEGYEDIAWLASVGLNRTDDYEFVCKKLGLAMEPFKRASV